MKTLFIEENEARLSQKEMDGVWCCELGKITESVAQPPEGASLRAQGISVNGRQTQYLRQKMTEVCSRVQDT